MIVERRARARSRRSSSRGAERRAPHRRRCWTRSSEADAIVIGPRTRSPRSARSWPCPGMREARRRGARAGGGREPVRGRRGAQGADARVLRAGPGIEPTAAGLAERLRGAARRRRGRRAGRRTCRACVTDTLMDTPEARARVARDDPGVCGLAARRVADSGARARYSRHSRRTPDAHDRDPPDQEPRRRQAAPVEPARERVAPGARAGDVLRRAGLAAPRARARRDRGGHRQRRGRVGRPRQRRAPAARPRGGRPVGRRADRHPPRARRRLRARAARAGRHPAARPAEVDALLGRSATPMAIVPDRHGTGTNGLLLAPPGGDRAELRPRQPRPPRGGRARRRARAGGRAGALAHARRRHARGPGRAGRPPRRAAAATRR